MRIDKDIEMWNLDRIVPYDRNPKRHPEVQIEKLARHIAEVGWDQPIVVDENNLILKGHGRRLAALKLGLKEVPVIVKAGLSELLKKKIRIADNKLSDSGWVPEMLKLELEDLRLEDMDLESIGFQNYEIENLFGDSEPIDLEEEGEEEPEFEFNEKTKEDKPEALILHVVFENEEDMQALFDELNSRGFMVKR